MEDGELKSGWSEEAPPKIWDVKAVQILAHRRPGGLLGYLRRRVVLDLGFKAVLLPVFLAIAFSSQGGIRLAALAGALVNMGLGWPVWREGWIRASMDAAVLTQTRTMHDQLERFKARALPALAFTGALMTLAFFLGYFREGFHPKPMHWPVLLLCLVFPPLATWRMLRLRIQATQAALRAMEPEATRLEQGARGLWVLAFLLVLLLLCLGLLLAL